MQSTPSGKSKTQPTPVTVDDFLETVSSDRRRADAKKIVDIMRRVSGVDPIMWGPTIIGFGSFHYRYASGHEGDTLVMGLSPRATATSVYGLYNANNPDARLAALGPHKVGKSCLYIKRFDDLNHDLFEALVREAWEQQGASC